MHILFITDNFSPESNAPAIRTYEHAKVWVKEGAKVTVITSAPNFPEGRVYDGYKNNWLYKETIDGIEVWRVKTFVSSNRGITLRILDFLSFMLSSFIFAFFVRKPNIVIGTSPQFFTVISSYAISIIKRTPFVFELRDFWPSSVVAVGAMEKNFVIKVFEKIEVFLYKRATLIICVTHAFKKILIERGINESKIKVITNGVLSSKFRVNSENKIKLELRYNFGDSYVAGYVGTIGMAHDIDNILNASKLIDEKHNIKIFIAGEGAEKERINNRIKKEKIDNVILGEKIQNNQIASMLSLCNISLVSLSDVEDFKHVIPSKIFESMAMGIPIIISMPFGEATSIIEDNSAGYVVKPNSPSELAHAIINASKVQEKELKLISENNIKTSEKYDREVLAKKMLKCLEDIN